MTSTVLQWMLISKFLRWLAGDKNIGKKNEKSLHILLYERKKWLLNWLQKVYHMLAVNMINHAYYCMLHDQVMYNVKNCKVMTIPLKIFLWVLLITIDQNIRIESCFPSFCVFFNTGKLRKDLIERFKL